MIPPRAIAAALLAAAFAVPSALAVDADASAVPSYDGGAAIPSSDYHDIYRGYLGMSEEQIAAMPWYQSTYGLAEDDCLSIAIIAHAAARPFATAVADFVGPCHRSLAELMRFYSVPTEVLFVQAPPTEVYPVYYHRLYEPYWGGYCDRAVYSNSDCCALFAFRISTEFWRCPPPLFFDHCVAYRSPGWALRRERVWWSRPAAPGFAPLPAREFRHAAPLPPQRVIVAGGNEHRAPAPAAEPSHHGAVGGSSAGVVPSERQQPPAQERSAPAPHVVTRPSPPPPVRPVPPVEQQRPPPTTAAPSHPHPPVAAPEMHHMAPPAVERHESAPTFSSRAPMPSPHPTMGAGSERSVERTHRPPGQ